MEKPTELIVIRHGQTTWNITNRFQGHLDIDLSELGKKQAERIADHLASEPIDVLYSSDLKRALDTALPLAQLKSLDVRTDTRLRERHMGIFQGYTFEQIREKFPEEYEKFMTWDPDYVMPDGESSREKYRRSIAFFEEIAAAHQGGTVAVITHGGVLDALLRFILGIPLSTPRRYKNYNASINRIIIDNRGWFLGTWGEVLHLRDLAE